jgi:hypothetical protein
MNGDGNPNAGGVGASRGPQGSSGFTALSPVYETRELKIAYGIQFHPGESLPITPQRFLDDHLELSDNLEKVSASEYINHLQGVRFVIEETTSKQKFIDWLKTPELHVIYMGHARYGRGPCFGARGLEDPNATPVRLFKTEDWEMGANADSGIFRMGYPYIGVEASEVIEHGYTANPVKESEGRPARADCDPDVRGHLGSLQARTPERILPGLVNQLRNHQDGDKYWTYHSSRGAAIIHHAGWRNTLSVGSDLGTLQDPGDPDNTQMQCRVFAHLGCTTFTHNYRVVRRIANWRHAGNERYAYWTSNLSAPHAVGPWVHGVISYDRWNAFADWGPSLDWAVRRANRSLRRLGARYHLI